MAVAYVQEFEIGDRSTKNYDFVADKVGDGPFDGLIIHTAGFDDEAGVFRILDVWETREQAERFLAEHVQPLIEHARLRSRTRRRSRCRVGTASTNCTTSSARAVNRTTLVESTA